MIFPVGTIVKYDPPLFNEQFFEITGHLYNFLENKTLKYRLENFRYKYPIHSYVYNLNISLASPEEKHSFLLRKFGNVLEN